MKIIVPFIMALFLCSCTSFKPSDMLSGMGDVFNSDTITVSSDTMELISMIDEPEREQFLSKKRKAIDFASDLKKLDDYAKDKKVKVVQSKEGLKVTKRDGIIAFGVWLIRSRLGAF